MKKKAENPSVYRVAERAGVSIATVSRTYTNSSLVKPSTRERVLKPIKELGFKPNPSARQLSSKKTGTIALVFPDITGPFYSTAIRCVE